MCCRIAIQPLDVGAAAAILLTGQFEEVNDTTWIRKVAEEMTTVQAQFEPHHLGTNGIDTPGQLTVSILPAVSAYHHHQGKRHAAGIMLEIAAKYAEKVGGLVTQHANIMECREGGEVARVLARYPLQHMDFSAICKGWQEEFTRV